MTMDAHRPSPGSANASLAFWAVFAAATSVLYVFAMELNLAAFTYHPRLVEFAPGVEAPKSGPAMYWYGWLATAAAGGIVAGLVAAIVARRIGAKVWLGVGWLVPAGAALAAVYFMIPFFTI